MQPKQTPKIKSDQKTCSPLKLALRGLNFGDVKTIDTPLRASREKGERSCICKLKITSNQKEQKAHQAFNEKTLSNIQT